MTRIAFIGAGSVELRRNLLGDILSFPELADADPIILIDRDAARRQRQGDGEIGADVFQGAGRRRACSGGQKQQNNAKAGQHRKHHPLFKVRTGAARVLSDIGN